MAAVTEKRPDLTRIAELREEPGQRRGKGSSDVSDGAPPFSYTHDTRVWHRHRRRGPPRELGQRDHRSDIPGPAVDVRIHDRSKSAIHRLRELDDGLLHCAITGAGPNPCSASRHADSCSTSVSADRASRSSVRVWVSSRAHSAMWPDHNKGVWSARVRLLARRLRTLS